MDYDIPTDPVELKRLHAYCQRLYYHSLLPEKKKVMQDKQRIGSRQKYQTDPVYAEKVKEYQKARYHRKKAEASASNASEGIQFCTRLKLLKGILPIHISKNGREAGHRRTN
jgi:hypothetical protein